MPYLFVEEPGLVVFHPDIPQVDHALLGMIRAQYWNDITVFSDEGIKLRVEPDRELPNPSLWERLRAATFFQPVWKIRLKYHAIGQYELPELKATIHRIVQEDTDILTQFMEREEILENLDAATTFEEVTRLARKMSDNTDEY